MPVSRDDTPLPGEHQVGILSQRRRDSVFWATIIMLLPGSDRKVVQSAPHAYNCRNLPTQNCKPWPNRNHARYYFAWPQKTAHMYSR